MPEIGLVEAISTIRRELAMAVARGVDADLQFPIEGVELEFQVAVTTSGETGGKVRFWVVEWGASVSQDVASTHRVTLRLGAPVDAEGRVAKVARTSPEKP